MRLFWRNNVQVNFIVVFLLLLLLLLATFLGFANHGGEGRLSYTRCLGYCLRLSVINEKRNSKVVSTNQFTLEDKSF